MSTLRVTGEVGLCSACGVFAQPRITGIESCCGGGCYRAICLKCAAQVGAMAKQERRSLMQKFLKVMGPVMDKINARHP